MGGGGSGERVCGVCGRWVWGVCGVVGVRVVGFEGSRVKVGVWGGVGAGVCIGGVWWGSGC